jgi:hypothetical protein
LLQVRPQHVDLPVPFVRSAVEHERQEKADDVELAFALDDAIRRGEAEQVVDLQDVGHQLLQRSAVHGLPLAPNPRREQQVSSGVTAGIVTSRRTLRGRSGCKWLRRTEMPRLIGRTCAARPRRGAGGVTFFAEKRTT